MLLAAIFGIDLALFLLAREARQRTGFRAAGLDLNTASRDQLARLPDVGPELADRIIENRPYRNKLDLVSRMVVPENIYEQVKHRIGVRVEPDRPVLTPKAV